MKREEAIERLQDTAQSWDVLVIGGGATGLGCAVDAAARGYRTLLVEQADFGSATSSRSTKLIHGGFRYLKQGNISLVRHSLRERGLLLRNAPHLVHRLSFVLPQYAWWERPYYGLGLKAYDALAGSLGLGASRFLSRKEALEQLPTLNPDGLRGGIRYYDGQFDDARLLITLLRTLQDLGGVAVNYARVAALSKRRDRVVGAAVEDLDTGKTAEVRSKVVINATGIFSDTIRRLDDARAEGMISASQGTHVVLPSSFLPGKQALMIPKTNDGRILFAIPWWGRVLVGTTDLPVDAPHLEPKPLDEEIAFLLEHAGRYLTGKPGREDVLSVFAGLRPLVSGRPGDATSKISRDHTILVSKNRLVTVTGGKWTTYRQMAEETVDRASAAAGLEKKPSLTRFLKLHGAEGWEGDGSPADVYGSDAALLRDVAGEHADWGKPLHERLPYTMGEVVWAVRREMGRTLEDVLSRRTRALILDARASLETAPRVAERMRQELGRNSAWAEDQIRTFQALASHYLTRPASDRKGA